jgi:hypothetical protein
MRALALLLLVGCGGFTTDIPAKDVHVTPAAEVAHQPLVALYRTFTGFAARSDVPQLVVYADGLILANEEDGRARVVKTRSARVTPAQAAELAARVVTPEFRKAPAYASTGRIFDHPPVTRVVAWLGGDTWKVAAVAGYDPDEHRRSREPFAIAVRTLRSYAPPGGWSPWQPEQLELVLTERDAGDDATPWPAELAPVPPESATRTYRHHVPAAAATALSAFLERHRHHALEANGRRWSVRPRMLVPADGLLLEVLRQADPE